MSSRLFQEIREKRGLCYSIYAFATSFVDDGAIAIYAGTGENEAAEISGLVAEQMSLLAQTANKDEIARAKAQMRSALLMGLERPSARAEQIAAHLLAYGRVVPIAELKEKLEAVTVDDVRRIGERLMATGRPALAAVGPLRSLESYDTFARRFGSAAPSSSLEARSARRAHAAG
jgi:predicted Zn-dependent peptidase